MKRVTVIAGQGSQNYGEKLTYMQVSEILKDKAMEFITPMTLHDALKSIRTSNGIIFAGRRVRNGVDALDVVNLALELEKPVFLFGVELGDMGKTGLKRFSTSLMSPLVSGFLTDAPSVKWALFWSKRKIEVGADLAHIYLLNHVKRKKAKYAVFAPRIMGTLHKYKEYNWFPKVDVRIIVANPMDSSIAVEVSRHVKTDEIVILSDAEDIMDTVANAKFVVSERFHVSLTAESFGVPFIHIGRRAMRYFGEKFIDNFSIPDDVEVALTFSKLSDEIPSFYSDFNNEVQIRYERMLKELERFLLLI